MEITFSKSGASWISEFQVSGAFNLHIEGVYEGDIRIYQRGTSTGAYSYVKGSTPSPSAGNVYDSDFSALVYPKYIKVVCNTKPTMAVVTTNA